MLKMITAAGERTLNGLPADGGGIGVESVIPKH